MLTLLCAALGFLVLLALGMGLAFPKGSTLNTTIGLGLVSFGNSTGSVVLDPTVANFWTLVATGNITLSAPQGFVPGQVYVLDFNQDATGGRTLAFSGITFVPLQGGTTAPTVTASTKTTYTMIARDATTLFIISKV